MADVEQAGTLEQELDAASWSVERFDPPEDVRARRPDHRPLRARAAARDPVAWWARAGARAGLGRGAAEQALDDGDAPFPTWFAGGTLNASHNCLDRHVAAGLGDRVAFHWHGEEGEERDVTYADLLRDVQRFANALKARGIGAGDVVGIYLPMIPEVVVAMLACARIGAPHNVVFGGFSPESVQRAHGLLGGQGAGHRRRRPAQGQHGAGQGGGRRGRHRRARRRSSSATPASTAPWATATSGTTRRSSRPTPSARRSRSTPSTRSTSSTRRARRRSPRASCTRRAAT